MITRPMPGRPEVFPRGHSDEPMSVLPHQQTNGPHGGYPAPIRRTKGFAFRPRLLPPVNKIKGSPRLGG